MRFWIAKNLWRSPLDYSESAMIETRSNLDKIEEFLRKLRSVKSSKAGISGLSKLFKMTRKNFYKSLDDDFNTPKAFAVLFNFIKKTNTLLKKTTIPKMLSDEIYVFFKEINTIFDIIDFKKNKQPEISRKMSGLLKERDSYRKSGEWKKADEIRKEIEKQGYTIEDTKEGPEVRKKT